jgi:hypothetical protein
MQVEAEQESDLDFGSDDEHAAGDTGGPSGACEARHRGGGEHVALI